MRRLEQNAGSFVLDSEPEREETRKAERVNRRRTRKQDVHPSGASHSADGLPVSDLESPVASGSNVEHSLIKDHAEPPSPPPINLSKYAHHAVMESYRRSTSISELSRQKVTKTDTQPENKPPPLSEPEVSHLNFCVACGVSWTVQKTAAQKLYHVQNCGRKNGFSLCTIRELLLNPERLNTIARASNSKPEKVSTLMEHILDEKKPPKRRRLAVTTQSVLETGHAQGILQNKARAALNMSSNVEDHPELPPPTQAFASSKLGQRFAIRQKPVIRSLASSDEEQDTSSCHDEIALQIAPEFAHAPLKSRFNEFSGQSLDTTGRDIQQAQAHEMNRSSIEDISARFHGLRMSQGSCFLHYSQPRRSSPSIGEKVPSLLSVTSSLDNLVPGPTITARRHLSTTTKSTSKRAVSGVKGPKVKKRASLGRPRKGTIVKRKKSVDPESPPTRKRAGRKPKDLSWHDDLRAALLSDHELYPRILRYEPLSLDLIAQHIDLPELSERALYTELKKFLDQECIVFYDADPNKGRNRRKRRSK